MTEEVKRRRRKPAQTEPATETAPVTTEENVAGVGHNSPPPDDPPKQDVSGVARDQLRAFIERIERLEEEKQTVADDIKDVYGELKGVGFDASIVREIIKLRKKDADEVAEREAVLDTYKQALGMVHAPVEYD